MDLLAHANFDSIGVVAEMPGDEPPRLRVEDQFKRLVVVARRSPDRHPSVGQLDPVRLFRHFEDHGQRSDRNDIADRLAILRRLAVQAGAEVEFGHAALGIGRVDIDHHLQQQSRLKAAPFEPGLAMWSEQPPRVGTDGQNLSPDQPTLAVVRTDLQHRTAISR